MRVSTKKRRTSRRGSWRCAALKPNSHPNTTQSLLCRVSGFVLWPRVSCFEIRCFPCLNGRLYAHTKAAAWPVLVQCKARSISTIYVPFGAMLALVSSGYKGPVLKFEEKTWVHWLVITGDVRGTSPMPEIVRFVMSQVQHSTTLSWR